jgi:galactokinase
MDQAASVMSINSSALYITFYPILNTSPVTLPPGAKFVISNTLVIADKVVTAKFHYNLRVVETLVGARILANNLGVKLDNNEKVTYREVLGRIVKEQQDCGSDGDMGTQALIIALKSVMRNIACLLPKGVDPRAQAGEQVGVTMDEMIEMSGLNPNAFREVYLSWIDGALYVYQIDSFSSCPCSQLKRLTSSYTKEPNMCLLRLYVYSNFAR